MLGFLGSVGDRMLAVFVPKVTAQAACVTFKRLCYCDSNCTKVEQWCDRGCDSTGTTCGPCNVKTSNGCLAPC
ncbi:hypothetical protein AB0C42_19025 [Micromonospora taraxaci]|uniref:hypothetical protein n=1 Tax=Micromonospora taraxaci TaxID=1316803 RepID=UPI00340A3F24